MRNPSVFSLERSTSAQENTSVTITTSRNVTMQKNVGVIAEVTGDRIRIYAVCTVAITVVMKVSIEFEYMRTYTQDLETLNRFEYLESHEQQSYQMTMQLDNEWVDTYEHTFYWNWEI